MEPIINPLWFYLFDMIDNICVLALVVGSLTGLFCVFLFLEVRPFDEKENKIFKRAVILCCASILFAALLPSKEVLCQMLVASYITPDNIELVGDAGQSIVDYIVESIGEILNK